MEVCPAHRFELGKHWRPSSACCHPEHTRSTQKRKVSVPDRFITPNIAKEITLIYGSNCIIGLHKYCKYLTLFIDSFVTTVIHNKHCRLLARRAQVSDKFPVPIIYSVNFYPK